jgi:hypothetical protein
LSWTVVSNSTSRPAPESMTFLTAAQSIIKSLLGNCRFYAVAIRHYVEQAEQRLGIGIEAELRQRQARAEAGGGGARRVATEVGCVVAMAGVDDGGFAGAGGPRRRGDALVRRSVRHE